MEQRYFCQFCQSRDRAPPGVYAFPIDPYKKKKNNNQYIGDELF